MRRLDVLKQHIFKSGKQQWKIGVEAGISETRLSAIVRGRVQPTEEEKAALSATLGEAEEYLFDQVEQQQTSFSKQD